MKYYLIETHPENASEYLKIQSRPESEAFVKALAELLKRGYPYICTDAIPIDWIVAAEQSAKLPDSYIIMMARAPVVAQDDLKRPHGIFYFARWQEPPE